MEQAILDTQQNCFAMNIMKQLKHMWAKTIQNREKGFYAASDDSGAVNSIWDLFEKPDVL